MSESSPQPAVETYETKPSLQNASAIGLQTGIAGAVVAAFQNAFQQHNRGAAGVLTRSGGTIGVFAMAGASYAFTESAVANAREKEDVFNHIAGGCTAGFISAIRSGSLPTAVASCAFGGAALGLWNYTNGLGGERKIERGTLESIEARREKFFKKKAVSEE